MNSRTRTPWGCIGALWFSGGIILSRWVTSRSLHSLAIKWENSAYLISLAWLLIQLLLKSMYHNAWHLETSKKHQLLVTEDLRTVQNVIVRPTPTDMTSILSRWSMYHFRWYYKHCCLYMLKTLPCLAHRVLLNEWAVVNC